MSNNGGSSATNNVHAQTTGTHTTHTTHISAVDGITSVTGGASASASGYYGLFLPPNLGGSGEQFAASVVDVCGGVGTYAVRCFAGSNTLGINECGPGAPMMTITEGTKEFAFASTTTMGGATTITSATCKITDGTAADCTAYSTVTGMNTKTETSSVMKITNGAEFQQQVFPVEFTAGLPKLKYQINNVCKSSAQTTKPVSVKLVGIAALMGVWAVLAL